MLMAEHDGDVVHDQRSLTRTRTQQARALQARAGLLDTKTVTSQAFAERVDRRRGAMTEVGVHRTPASESTHAMSSASRTITHTAMPGVVGLVGFPILATVINAANT